MSEERDDIVVLIDEDGSEVEFEHLDTIEMDGQDYVVLLPLNEDEDSEEEQDLDEVVILKIDHTKEGEDSFVTIDDDKELEKVFEEFKLRVEQEYEFEDDEE